MSDLPVTKRGEYWWLDTPAREVRLSNLDKVFFPDAGYTKRDLLTYYWNARDRVIPYVLGRPLTMIWYPDGIEGGRILMKDPPKHAPDWLPTCHIPHFEGGGDANDFPMIEDESHLMYLVNLGCIDLHPLHAGGDEPARPDYVFVDCDPSQGATFDDVRAVALHVRAAFHALGLPSYAKSTGSRGMHVYIPIERRVGFRHTREFVEKVALAIRRADPDRVTLEHAVAKRAGKVLIDYTMNRRGQNAVAAWCIRPVPAASVAVPVTWEEVEDGFEPSSFHIGNALDRPDDPMNGLRDKVDIRDAMAKLGISV